MADVRIMVVSDIHAQDSRFPIAEAPTAPAKPQGSTTWLDYGAPSSGAVNPIDALIAMVAHKRIGADFLLIPGDICDRANGDALVLAWADIERLRNALGASLTIATAGNHDLDSRYRAHPYDPRARLIALRPGFPVVDASAATSYWAYGVGEVRVGDVRFVVVNSCAYHGGAQHEAAHGRISEDALARVRNIADGSSHPRYNIAVCHHHPHPLPGGGAFAADDRMFGGETLLDIFDHSHSSWLVVHGHRHIAHLGYARGDLNRPPVLAAGSACVRLDPPAAMSAQNQAHCITLRDGAAGHAGVCGRVESWNYTPRVGWATASDGGGLPRWCGFGFRGELNQLVDAVANSVHKRGGPMPWADLISAHPGLEFLTPTETARVVDAAPARGIKLQRVEDGEFEAAEL